jgi:chromosome segregation protein
MTRIVKMEMKGFKSFANKTEVVFGDRFNVILGPNGSGKSNVLDALCFVLGKTSAKGLRAEKSANLIYNGGKTKKSSKEGEVSIFFDNTDKTFPLDIDLIKITRIIKDSGQSVYKINDKKHSRTEMVEMLLNAKISSDSHSIILQGDIVRFVEMSTVERRNVLEEISGIGAYEEKKHKAQNELDKVEKGLNDAKIILTEREHYLNDLKKERDQAIRFREFDTQIKQNKATLIHLSLDKKTKELKGVEEKIGGHQGKIDNVQKEIDRLKSEAKERKDEINGINNKIEERGETEQVALHKEVENLKVEVVTKKQRIEDLGNELQRLGARKEQLVSNRKDIEKKILELKSQSKETDTQKLQNAKLQKEITDKITAFKKKHKLESAADVDAEIEDIDKKIDVQSYDMQELRVSQQDHIREKDRLEIQITNMDEKIDKIEGLAKEHKGELDALKQKRQEFKKTTLELSQALSEDSSMSAQLSTARGKQKRVQEDEARLGARNASIQEKMGGDIAITKVMENKSKLGEVVGTVSTLGTTDSRFSLALEVAAGNRLKGIVVQDDTTAARCIKYLRESKLGVATFLPLNKVRGRKKDVESEKLAKADGCYGFAVDLIDFDPKYKNIFTYVFGSTLVVENIDVARRLGVGSVKMVTLNGDVSEKSGAMRGGFMRTKGRGSGFMEKDLQNDIRKVEAELSDVLSLVTRLEEKKTDNEENIIKLRELKAHLEGDIIKSEKSLHLDSDDLDVSRKLKREFQEKLTDVDKEFSELQSQISQKNKVLAEFKMRRQKLRAQISELRNPTKIAELNTFEERLAKLREEAIHYVGQGKNSQSQIENILRPEQENIEKILKQQGKEEEEFVNEQKQLKETVKTLKGQLKEKEEKEKKFYAKFKELFAKRNKLQEEVEKREEKTIAKEEQIRTMEKRSNMVSLEIARLKAEMSALDEEMEQYKDIEITKEKDISVIKHKIASAENKLAQIGAVNMKALEVYENVEKEYNKLVAKRDKLMEEKETIHEMMNEIETRKRELFLKMFEVVNNNFKKIFMTLSVKGEAFLELEDPDNPFEAGVRIKVRLTGKKFMDIRSLSGGEKTMTALAFIFAIQENDPASFYIMDEVDAALDKRNSERLADLVNDYSKKAQYIVISHNDGLIASAENLYGVSMNESGISKVISLKI